MELLEGIEVVLFCAKVYITQLDVLEHRQVMQENQLKHFKVIICSYSAYLSACIGCVLFSVGGVCMCVHVRACMRVTNAKCKL